MENEVFEHISNLAGDYKCFDEKISHQESLILCNLIEEIQQYRAIGTVEEFKALKEKATSKKVIVKKSEIIELDICNKKGNIHLCPYCNDYIVCTDVKNCSNCGQKLDWE